MPAMGPLFLLYLLVTALDLLAWRAPAWQDWAVARGWFLAWWLLLTAAMGLYAVSPFLAMRLPGKYLASLPFFPLYLGWKLVVSLGGRPTGWHRTTRESRADSLGERGDPAGSSTKGRPDLLN
jgi:hypothetical protein